MNSVRTVAGEGRIRDTAGHVGELGTDGAEWVIESLQKDKYRFAARWSPGDAFRDAGVYLIKLSGLKGEIY